MNAPSKFRYEEELVRQFLQSILPDTEVEYHDDGSRDSMHDLDLVRGSVRYGACEVTALADPAAIQVSRLVRNNQPMPLPTSTGVWALTLRSDCKVKALLEEIDPILAGLDSSPHDPILIQDLRSLGVASEHRSGSDRQGRVYFNVRPTNGYPVGFVETNGDRLVDGLCEWLHSSPQEHNLTKLESSGLGERHLAVVVPLLTLAPFDVQDALFNPDEHLPTKPLSMPTALTHVWLISTMTPTSVLGWGPSGWNRYPHSAGRR